MHARNGGTWEGNSGRGVSAVSCNTLCRNGLALLRHAVFLPCAVRTALGQEAPLLTVQASEGAYSRDFLPGGLWTRPRASPYAVVPDRTTVMQFFCQNDPSRAPVASASVLQYECGLVDAM